jgi:hypothetical protein
MQKSQPTARLSIEENQMYKRGYDAGFEAGQRAIRDKGTQQQINRINGQPFTSGTGNRRSLSQDNKDIKTIRKIDRNIVESRPIQVNKPIKTGRLSNEFQAQKTFDNPTIMRTNPETEIQSNIPEQYSRPIQGTKTIKTGRLSNEFPSQKPFDNPTNIRNVRVYNKERDIGEETTNPETEIQLSTNEQYSRPVQVNKPIKTERLSNEIQTEKTFDNPTVIRKVQVNNQEHEMEGKTTNPGTEVQFNARGHY